MAETLAGLGARVVSGGTDNHLMLVDVTPLGVTGKEAEHLLDEIGITVNKNADPVRHAAAEHGVRHPHRNAGDDLARVRARRDAGRRRGSSSTRSGGATTRPPSHVSPARSARSSSRFPVPGLPAA